ncbi:unnamed protein product, partial [Brugia timori]|uniref:AIP3 domain-containing protein n=1 Tax=Brugia timori TaxID=42155 RepID=A0A0R3QQU8_9BILA
MIYFFIGLISNRDGIVDWKQIDDKKVCAPLASSELDEMKDEAQKSVVYLELNDEVKRALLPPSVRSIDTVRALFLRSFPQLTSQYLSLPYVKIYIQESSKGQLFYELDDLRDIKDQAVLKLREQSNGYQTTQSNRFISNHSSLDYLSESEIDLMDYRNRVPAHRYRPASALDSRMLSAAGTIKSTRYFRNIF